MREFNLIRALCTGWKPFLTLPENKTAIVQSADFVSSAHAYKHALLGEAHRGRYNQALIFAKTLMPSPKPTEIIYHQQSKQLEVNFDNNVTHKMSAEFLRVNSPSAEVQGHGPGQAVLQLEKENIGIDAIEPVGNYAVMLRFSDGHDTGIFSWEGLYQLGADQDALWDDYLNRLKEAGYQRKAAT